MSLRQKLLVLIFSTLALITIILSTAVVWVTLRSFEALEKEDTLRNLTRVQEAIMRDFQQMERAVADYSYWDLTYAFANGENPDSLPQELSIEALTRLEMDVAFLVDGEGNLLFQRMIDRDTGEEISLPSDLNQIIEPGNWLANILDKGQAVSGLVSLQNEVLMVAAEPVLPGSGEGPARGMLLMGRWLDSAHIQYLGNVTKLTLEIEPAVSAGQIPEDYAAVMDDLSSPEEMAVVPLNTQIVSGYARMDDLQKQPGIYIRIDQPRSIYNEGRSTLTYLIIIMAASGLIIGLVIYVAFNWLVLSRLALLTGLAQRISRGELDTGFTPGASKDEIGILERSMGMIVEYLSDVTRAAQKISTGSVSVKITPRSEHDQLGLALGGMITRLQSLVSHIHSDTEQLSTAVGDLSRSSQESGQATSQIAITLQQISTGIAQESESIGRTAYSVDQMTRGIQGIVVGAREQDQAVKKVSSLTMEMNQEIDQVARNAQSMDTESASAAAAAQNGASTVKQTIEMMDRIREQVGATSVLVQEMGKHSRLIDSIVDTIHQIASQTNLLALNAAIEAARASGKTSQVTQQLLQNQLVGAAFLVAEVDQRSRDSLTNNDLVTLANVGKVDTLLITDEDGVITQCNDSSLIGYRFSEDPREQSYEFRPLLRQRGGVVIQPIQPRSKDGLPFMWVGVSRSLQPGIIQAGMPADIVRRNATFAQGFAVVADEVRKLADQATQATKEVRGLIEMIQKTISDAKLAMDGSNREIEGGVQAAHRAGEELEGLIDAAQQVREQAGQVSRATIRMSGSAKSLVEAVDIVAAVVDSNLAATQSMNQSATEVAQAMENIASISEENSASVEEVTANTGEMAQQAREVVAAVDLLQEMAEGLRVSMQDYH